MERSKRMIRMITSTILTAAFVALAVIPPVGAYAEVAQAPAKETSKGLVLVYLNGTDLETGDKSGTASVNHMIEASKAGNTRFVILAGGTNKWEHPALQDANDGGIASYVIENGTIRKLQQYEKGGKAGNAGKYLTSGMITQFVQDTKAKYSAKHTSMFFWDHGGGAAGGYGSNEITGESMSASAVAQGIRDSETKFEAVGFDTCLMGSLEVASNFSGLADYYIGSQENESSNGWDYRGFANYGTGDFKDFGKSFIAGYDKWNEEKKPNKKDTLTLSVLDMSKVPDAQKQWNEFLTTYGSNKIGIQQILAARKYAREFCYDNSADSRAGEVDLGDFLSWFGSEQANKLKTTLKNTVLYTNNNNMPGVNGLSVFIPGENVFSYSLNYNDIKANNLTEPAMQTLDRIASVFAGKKSSLMFGETWSDQKHTGNGNSFQREKWYDKEYAALGSDDTYSYKNVQNGGFAVESELKLTADQLQESELRVMLKNDNGYINLGRVQNFSKTKDTKSPVFNFNGNWLHINGQPVMIYQYSEYDGSQDKHHYKDYYTLAKVNNELVKLVVEWDATDKKWNLGGYVKENEKLGARSTEILLKPDDSIQFVYDMADSAGNPVGDSGRNAWGGTFKYDYDSFELTTQPIAGLNMDVIFHGTITDSYGKTYTTPYFKMNEGTNKVTEEKVGSETDVMKKSEHPVKEGWEIADANSFLTFSYSKEQDAYTDLDENTNAFDLVLVDPGEKTDTINIGEFDFRYDTETKLFVVVNAEGVDTDVKLTAEELAAYAAQTGSDLAGVYAKMQQVMGISENGESAVDNNTLPGAMNETNYDPSHDTGYIDEYSDYDGESWGSDDDYDYWDDIDYYDGYDYDYWDDDDYDYDGYDYDGYDYDGSDYDFDDYDDDAVG